VTARHDRHDACRHDVERTGVAVARAGADHRRREKKIVTAQRRAEALKGVPMTVEVISDDEIAAKVGFKTAGAAITWTHPSDQIYPRLWGTHLTDERYRLHYTGNSQRGTYPPMAEPRTYDITVGYRSRTE
jgi:hypothetical protein